MRSVFVLLALTPLLAKEPEPVKRLQESATVFSEIMATPDKGIPQDLLAKAHCIVIVPGLKKGASLSEANTAKGTYPVERNVGWAGLLRVPFALRAAVLVFKSVAPRPMSSSW
jgi:hypothetical protein